MLLTNSIVGVSQNVYEKKFNGCRNHDVLPCKLPKNIILDKDKKPIWLNEDSIDGITEKKVNAKAPPGIRIVPVVIQVNILVNTKGEIVCVKAVNGHFLLKESAVKAAKGWKFKPIIYNSKKGAILAKLYFEFGKMSK
jgi:hypothetical protein